MQATYTKLHFQLYSFSHINWCSKPENASWYTSGNPVFSHYNKSVTSIEKNSCSGCHYKSIMQIECSYSKSCDSSWMKASLYYEDSTTPQNDIGIT